MFIDPFDRGGLQDAEAALKRHGVDAYFRSVERWTDDGYAVISGRKVIMAGSNDYLGLSRHPEVIAAAAEALGRYGASVSGSRPLNGTIELHEHLEDRMAAFLGQESAAVATTGFQANLSIAAAMGRDDVAFSDAHNHASLVDGLRLSSGTIRVYRHADLDHLRLLLGKAPREAGRLIVTDGVFSMEGDTAPVTALRELADEFGAKLIVDSAHDLGVLHPCLGTSGRADLITGTFSKALGSIGGVIAGPAANVRRLRYNARSLVFSAALPPASAAAALAALDVLEAEPQRRDRLFELARALHDGLRGRGLDTRPSTTPIVPLRFPDMASAGAFWAGLFEAGVVANLVGPPATRGAMLRLTLTADHDLGHAEQVVQACAAVASLLGTPRALQPLPTVNLAR